MLRKYTIGTIGNCRNTIRALVYNLFIFFLCDLIPNYETYFILKRKLKILGTVFVVSVYFLNRQTN